MKKKQSIRIVATLWGLLLVAAVGQALTEPQRAPVAAMSAAIEVSPPVGKDSVKFLVIGDSGTGDRAQHETAAQMWKAHATFPYEFAIMLGDNMYGSERPQDYARKFERPFKALLDGNIAFYASLGNHDDPNQRFYKNFNMGGKRFYTFEKKDVKFFVLDSNYMDQDQQRWLLDELSRTQSKWKIAYFHHPLYSSGGRKCSWPARLGSRPARHRRADVHQVQRQRRVRRPRAFLRAPQAPEGHPLLHRRRLREAARGRHHDQLAVDGERLRHRAELHARRNRRRRDALPDHLETRQEG
jgi:hypothetical protein